jgi:hypothetical protein
VAAAGLDALLDLCGHEGHPSDVRELARCVAANVSHQAGNQHRFYKAELQARLLASPQTEVGFGFQQRGWRAAERRLYIDRERMGSPTLQTLEYPILLPPSLCFRGGGFPKPAQGNAFAL